MFSKIRKFRAVLRKPIDQRSLADKIFIGTMLAGIERVIGIVLRIGSTLIVTRLLSPEIFGLFALIMTFQAIIGVIADFGIRSLIITTKDPKVPEFLRTCWTVQVLRGLCLYGIFLLVALAIFVAQQVGLIGDSTVYGEPVLPLALAVNGVSLVFYGFESVNQHVYAKEMRFRLITIKNIVFIVVQPTITIAIAIFFPSIWALVIAGLIAWALGVFMSFFLFSGPAMGFCWNKEHTGPIFSRGKWLMLRSVMTGVTDQADKILLGAFVPPALFGTYYLAKQFVGMPHSFLKKLQKSFGLQFFREIIDLPKAEMHARYYKYRFPIDGLSCVFAGGFLTAAPAVIDLMYDPRYADAGFILQIIGLGLPLFGLGLLRDAWGVQQRFRITALFGSIQAISIWVGVAVALIVFESTLAAFFVIALHRLPELLTLLFMAKREGWVDLLKEVRAMPLIGLGALMGWGLSLAIRAIQ